MSVMSLRGRSIWPRSSRDVQEAKITIQCLPGPIRLVRACQHCRRSVDNMVTGLTNLSTLRIGAAFDLVFFVDDKVIDDTLLETRNVICQQLKQFNAKYLMVKELWSGCVISQNFLYCFPTNSAYLWKILPKSLQRGYCFSYSCSSDFDKNELTTCNHIPTELIVIYIGRVLPYTYVTF